MNSHTLCLKSPADRIEYCQHPCGNVEILDIVVGSERRQGQGRKLIEGLKEKCKTLKTRCLLMFAVTRCSNVVAQQFYEACGFRIIARLHNFYHDDQQDGPTTTESALMYGLDL